MAETNPEREFPGLTVAIGLGGILLLPSSIEFFDWIGGGITTALSTIRALNASEWAAWVQAIGSIGAILVAVWVSRKSVRDALEKDVRDQTDRETRLIRSLRAEVQTLWENYSMRIAPLVEKMKTDPDAWLINAPTGKLFPIYEASARDVGLISNEPLRMATVIAYGRARGFIGTLEYTSKLVDKISAMQEGAERKAWRQLLVAYRQNVIQAHDELTAGYHAFWDLAKDI